MGTTLADFATRSLGIGYTGRVLSSGFAFSADLGLMSGSYAGLRLGRSSAKGFEEAMRDLRAVGVEVLTLGQCLRPSAWHLPVVEFVTPEIFAAYEAYVDYEIGRVIQAIEDMGKLDNTLVIYINGDNGTSADQIGALAEFVPLAFDGQTPPPAPPPAATR